MPLRPRTWPLALTLAALVGCGASHPGLGDRAQAGEVGAKREIVSRITGDPPNFAQLSNDKLLTVVSREFGRGAKAGALVELFGKNYASEHLWDAYVGVVQDGKLTWAHDMKLLGQTIVADTGRVVSRFEGRGYTLTIEDVVPPEGSAHLRRVSVAHTGGPARPLSVVHYGYFTLDHLPTGDRARFDAESRALVQVDGHTAVAVKSTPAASAWHLGHALMPATAKQDARMAAEAGRFNGLASIGAAPSGVNGTLKVELGELAPGASAEATFALALAGSDRTAVEEANRALTAGFAAAARAEAAHWARFLDRAVKPAIPPEAQAVYRRALIALRQMTAENGAIIAAPTNMNPPYRFVWPRDGSLIALTMLKAGYAAEARRFFEFCERLQQPSGGFAVNYFPDGSKPFWDFGSPGGNEHDQVGMYAWGVERVASATGDRAWLASRWDSVRKACEFLLREQRPDGLLTPCRDLWELDTDGTWTYSNGAAWAGLMAGATVAEQMNRPEAALRYRAAAGKLEAAIRAHLVVNGYLARGLRKKGLDPTVEAANLALGGPWFRVMKDSDPVMRRTGEEVARRLTSPDGGIRRYENDQYYDGQPWPVATGWLALHQLALGDRAGARRLFDVMTRYAHATDSLQLGEQYDEKAKRWASAFPLAWSEATYVETALELFK